MGHRLTVRIGTSKGRDTYGYTTMIARDSSGRKVAGLAGGGFDLWNTLLCQVISNLYQAELQAALQAEPLEGTGLGSHPLYCFHRRDDGCISVLGAGGSTITSKALALLGLELTERKIGHGRWEIFIG